MKETSSQNTFLQTKIARMAYTFQKKMESCSYSYLEFWKFLICSKKDIEKIKSYYNEIFSLITNVKAQWKKYGYILSKVPAIITTYIYFVEVILGDKEGAKKIYQQSYEKNKKELNQEEFQILERRNFAFFRCSADTVLLLITLG